MTLPQRMWLRSSACKQASAHSGSMSERRLQCQQHHTHASWRASKTGTEEKKLLNKFVIFLMSLLPFWTPNMSVALLSMQGQKALDFIKNILICVPKDVRRSYRFGTTLGWVIKDRFFGGVNYPFQNFTLYVYALLDILCYYLWNIPTVPTVSMGNLFIISVYAFWTFNVNQPWALTLILFLSAITTTFTLGRFSSRYVKMAV